MKFKPNILCYVPCINLLRVFFRKYGLCAYVVAFLLILQIISGYYIIYLVFDGAIEGETERNVERSINYGPVNPKTEPGFKVNDVLQHTYKAPSGAEQSPCEVLGKDAQSAFNRAQTKECREKISNISCQVQSGTFFHTRLTSFCSSSGYTRGKYMGCFVDQKERRLLTGFSTKLKHNSPFICADLCLQRGFIYAGVEFSKECFCGNDELLLVQRTSDSECDMPCEGSSQGDIRCGGFFRINIAQTGLERKVPSALKKSVLPEEASVRIAFILTVNGRSLRQVKRLIKALYHDKHYFFIHVDLRQQYLYDNLLLLEEQFANILLSKRRYSSIWGGASLLSVHLHSMKMLIKQQGWQWDFVINLSESDYPIKTVASLSEFLSANKGRNFLKSHGQNTNTFLKKQGLDRTFLECENHMWRLGRRHLPLGLQMDGGSDWFCLNRQYIDYIVHSQDQLVEGLKKFFSYTLLPSESFFHTVLRNCKYCSTFTDNNLRLTNWNRKLGCRCQYKNIVDWCGCSPNDITPKDWPKLLTSQSKTLFFARKFEPVKSLSVINQLDEWLFGDYKKDTPGLYSHWDNRYHFKDHPSDRSDAELTLYHACLRLSLEFLKQRSNNFANSQLLHTQQTCDISLVKLQEVQAYFQHDQLKGFLISFETENMLNQRSTIEIWIQRQKYLQTSNESVSSYQVKDMQTHTKFDLKEQMFRNVEGALSSRDQLTIAIWWQKLESDMPLEEEYDNPYLVLSDPFGNVIRNASVKLEHNGEDQVTDNTFLDLHENRPGLWTVHLLYRNRLLATHKFAILPLLFLSGTSIPSTTAKTFETYYNEPYHYSEPQPIVPDLPDISKVDPTKTFRAPFKLSFTEWTDQIVKSFYTLTDICQVVSSDSCVSLLLPACSGTEWSSFSADPKNDLGPVDPHTGRLTDPIREAA